MRLIVFLTVLPFMISFVSGIEIGVSPVELIFGDSEDENCQEIKLMSDDKRLFNLNDKWNTFSNSRSPVFYIENSGKAGVFVDYERQVIVSDGFKMVKVCLKSAKKGNKQGILFFDSNGASLGVRMAVKSKENREIQREIGITGGVVNDNGLFSKDNKIIIYLGVFDIILLVILFTLVYFYKKRRLSNY